jgi:hypothetical protein
MDDFGLLIESLNAGEPVPTVERQDLRAALLFFDETRSILARRHKDMGVQGAPEVSFFLEDLAERCSPDANVPAVAIRAMLLEQMLKMTADPEEQGIIAEEVATMPLRAADLGEPETVLSRLRKTRGTE